MQERDLSHYVLNSTYARKPDEKWSVIAGRIAEMFKYYYRDRNINDLIDKAFSYVATKKVLSSQRLAQFAGDPTLKNHVRAYNCSGTHCDRPLVFGQAFFILLSGGGTGVSVQQHHVDKLSCVSLAQNDKKLTFVIPDTIEGWSDAVTILVANNLEQEIPGFEEWNAKHGTVVFDFVKIRAEGTPISSGGLAPGPKPLRIALKKIKEVFESAKKSYNRRLTPLNCIDIFCHISDGVLAGGVRRSSCLALVSPNDKESIRAKTGDWWKDNPQRGRVNISVALNTKTATKAQFNELMASAYEYGEPGIFFVQDNEYICNPCAEIGFWPYLVVDQAKFDEYMKTYDGQGFKRPNHEIGVESGWQLCNLSTINTSNIENKEDLLDRAEAAAIIGTLQAGLHNMGYLGSTTEKIVRKDALLGVSMSGIMVNPDITLNPEIQREIAEKIKATNRKVADLIDIRWATRTTCIKPDGNSGCLLGCSSSIMPYHSRRYLRWVRVKANHPVGQLYQKVNPHAVQPAAMNDGNNVIAFCMETPKGARTKYDITSIQLLDAIKTTQQNYVLAGNSEWNNPHINNNVSNTVTVKSDEWYQVGDYIWDNKEYFGGITLMREYGGEMEYQQAPFTSVALSEKELRIRYSINQRILEDLSAFAAEITKKLGSVWTFAHEFISGDRLNEKGTSMGKCLRLAAGYTEKHFGGDRTLFTYCLKDIYNFDLYNLIAENHKRVNYKELNKKHDATLDEENQGSAACTKEGCSI